MKKKLLLVLLTCMYVMVLTACGHEHTWLEATCTAPKTCAECGETEGEVVEHVWTEATCAEAKKCSVCGETEGESLEHTWTEANYQQAKKCSVCEATEGEPLQADFEKFGLQCNVELGKFYDGVVMCKQNTEKTASPKVVFSNYCVFESDENHPAKDGYEWKTVDVVMFFYDENAMRDGWKLSYCYENYYDILTNDETAEIDDESGTLCFSVNYNGIEYTECQEYETNIDKLRYENRDSIIRAWTVHYLVPKGYDGCVYGIRNAQIEWGDNQHINDIDNTDTLFFRFANKNDVKEDTEHNVSEINLSYEVAVKIINNFYMNMMNYFNDETIGFFDFDQNMKISQDESNYLLFWALDNYNIEHSSVLSEEATILSASDYLKGNLNVPDTLYKTNIQ